MNFNIFRDLFWGGLRYSFNICEELVLIMDNFWEFIYLFVLIKVGTVNIYFRGICYIGRCMLDITDIFGVTAEAGAKPM